MKNTFKFSSIASVSITLFLASTSLFSSNTASIAQNKIHNNYSDNKSIAEGNSRIVSTLYSRGNDDPNENNYETAKIKLILECNSIPENKTGKVKLKYIAYPSSENLWTHEETEDVDHNEKGPLLRVGTLFRLEEDGANSNNHSPNLSPIPGSPESSEGDAIVTELTIDLPENIWNGTEKTGDVYVVTDSEWYMNFISKEGKLADTAVFANSGSIIQQTIGWKLEIDKRGKISKCEASAFQHLLREGGVPTPLIDITSGNAGYADFPGTPRM